MKKVIRNDMGYPIGWTNTKERKGTYSEFCDGAKYTYQGTVSETLQSLDVDLREDVRERGELF